MDARIKSIQLQNRIPTRQGGRKTRRSHKKRRRLTHRRGEETHEECGNLIGQRTIPGYPRNRRYQNRRIGETGIPRQGRGRNTEGKQHRHRDPRHQKKLGPKKQRNEGNSAGAMPMETQSLMIPRKDLDTKRPEDTNRSCR